MRFRPCIDLHDGQVKQIVGGSLRDDEVPETNFASPHSPAYYAELYRRDNLPGGHVIKLGPGNEEAAREALAAYPDGLHVGGGIDADNAAQWLDWGAQAVIATSYVFRDGSLQQQNLERLADTAGPDRLVLDLSCAPEPDGRYVVATDRWQRRTDFTIDPQGLERLSSYCFEFLIHATQVEGKRAGVDAELIALLADSTPLPTTYAGGVKDLADVEIIEKTGQGRLDYTVGSALDIFGGDGVRYEDLVNRST
ncbi:MAG: phosphoribosylformimino-5-aminoimidazole carboxamide ribotide isomerase [Gemmatimonadetes bacterium]|nr:phosphoribosylformimino-5-aminoimidazole carboxamide ribotide isomerase [Gemmatimonadota bacterium]